MSYTTVVEHYNQHVHQMQNHPWFYDWLLSIWDGLAIPPDAAICDLDCGTGALLARLHERGYRHLSGADFAPACIAVTQSTVPDACVFVQDIVQSPLPSQYDVIILTTVIDFVADPVAALRNVCASLKPGGHLIMNIRNRQAYWPFYHLRGLAQHIANERTRHWFLWFTTPLGLRRTDQPYEQVYSPSEARALLQASGLRALAEYGFHCFPMLWIPELPRWIAFMQRLDAWARYLPGKARYYNYFFVCQAEGNYVP